MRLNSFIVHHFVGVPKSVLGLLILMFLCGCQKQETTTASWHPIAPIGVELSVTGDGLYKASIAVPVAVAAEAVGVEVPINSLGVFTLEHQIDLRQDSTYIVIRNREKGIDQVFQVGVRGYVELTLSGEHRLLLHNEGENKFVIDDVSHSPIEIKFYPQGEERASVSIGSGPDFVILTDHRLHIEYASIYHPRLLGNSFSGFLHKDDDILLDSVKSVDFTRDFRVSQLTFNWKPPVSQAPLVVVLPNGGEELKDEVVKLLSTLKGVAPDVHFTSRSPELGIMDTKLPLIALVSICVLMLLKFIMPRAKSLINMAIICVLLVGVALVARAVVVKCLDPGYLTYSESAPIGTVLDSLSTRTGLNVQTGAGHGLATSVGSNSISPFHRPQVSSGVDTSNHALPLNPPPETKELSGPVLDVRKLLRAKLADDLILQFIQKNPALFQMNGDDILLLKKDGASERIIMAMLQHDGQLRNRVNQR